MSEPPVFVNLLNEFYESADGDYVSARGDILKYVSKLEAERDYARRGREGFRDLYRAAQKLNHSIVMGVQREKAEAWDEGHAASERDWQLTFDITTPDEERQPLTNPYREVAE